MELLQDQAGLQKLHDNLQQEYETLLKDKEVQKETEKQLRSDLRKLQVRNCGIFTIYQSKWLKFKSYASYKVFILRFCLPICSQCQ